MEYIFGTTILNGENVETLKTIGAAHTSLEDITQVKREYPDGIITDTFRIVEKYHSDEDTEGNCYDWYVISNHYRYVDKSNVISALEETIDLLILDALGGN